MVTLVLFTLPLSLGVSCAAICLLLRRLTARRAALDCAASFLLTAGIGIGLTASIMHVQGYRIAQLQPIYDLPHRDFLKAVDTTNRKRFNSYGRGYSPPQESENG